MTQKVSREHGNSEARVVVDAHVHIHDCFDLHEFLCAALSNFASESPKNLTSGREKYVLCLTEAISADRFGEISRQADVEPIESDETNAPGSHWRFHSSGEQLSVKACHPTLGEIFIVAGRQVTTREHLEILVLGTLSKWDDGLPAADVVDLAIREGAIPVLAWGFGKWLGRRRHVVESLIDRFSDGSLFLGDNSGRPRVIARPAQFTRAEALGVRILRGTDPLPFRSEYNRAGSFGFYVDGIMIDDGIWAGLCAKLLQNDVTLHNFGSLEMPYRFVRNQLAMQFVTRILNRRTAS